MKCEVCGAVVYRSDYLSTHMRLRHSDNRTKLKCPYKKGRKNCGKLFGQVKNFIHHYVSKHEKDISEAKRVAGKNGSKLERVNTQNADNSDDAPVTSKTSKDSEHTSAQNSPRKKVEIIENVQITQRFKLNVDAETNMVYIGENDEILQPEVIETIETIESDSTEDERNHLKGFDDSSIHNAEELSHNLRSEANVPLNLCIRNAESSNEILPILQSETELPLNLCIANEREPESNESNDLPTVRKIIKRVLNTCLPLDLTKKGNVANNCGSAERKTATNDLNGNSIYLMIMK